MLCFMSLKIELAQLLTKLEGEEAFIDPITEGFFLLVKMVVFGMSIVGRNL